jgi:small-conductance mechanosensitive channel
MGLRGDRDSGTEWAAPSRMLTRLFEGSIDRQSVLLALALTIAIGWLAARLVRGLAAAALRVVARDRFAESHPLLRGPLRLLAVAAFLLVVAILLFPAFQIVGLRPRTGLNLRMLGDWTFSHGLNVLLIVILAYAVMRITALLALRFEHDMTVGTGLDAMERGKRARTLSAVIQNFMTVLIGGIAVLMVLKEFQLDITPILTGAGIVGLAVGFGAQTLVRDIISGFFLILENQVRVGDEAAINGTPGLVEAINLRTIVLRDIEGTVHVFPNGAINTLANRSKDFSYYVIDLAVSYYDDSDRVAGVLRDVAAELQRDPVFGPSILEPIEILGIDSFTEWAARLKARIKTVPLKQWEVGRELRRRVIKAFRQHGFAIPFPVPNTAVQPESAPGPETPGEPKGAAKPQS